MARSIESALQTEFLADHFRPISLFEFEFSGTPVRFWTGLGDLTWNSNTYTGSGDLLTFAPIQESGDTGSISAEFQLSGLNSALISNVLGQIQHGDEITVYVGALDADGAVVIDPLKIFEGLVDVANIRKSADTAVISVTAENRTIRLNRPKARRWTKEDQQRDYANDTAFNFTTTLQQKQFRWGG